MSNKKLSRKRKRLAAQREEQKKFKERKQVEVYEPSQKDVEDFFNNK